MQRNVLEYLEETAKRLPDKVALVDEAASYSFQRLLTASRAIGSGLLSHVPQRGFVVVLCDRTAIGVPGLLGVLQCGACYVLVDANMPRVRMEAVLTQVKPDAILYAQKDEKIAQSLLPYAPILSIEAAAQAEIDDMALAERREASLDLDPAYVIFTSGSTGTPKGILVAHRSLGDFTDWLVESCGITEHSILANQSPLFFDTSLKNLMPCMATGATVHMLSKKFFSFPLLLTRYLNEHRVNTLIWSTAAFHMVANSGVLEREPPAWVHTVAVGGEALMAPQLNRWRRILPEARYFNHYGPTEVTVDCIYFPITREFRDDEQIPIGKACQNMEILLLDEQLRPVADGEAGEICVRGTGLALGYLGDAEKTASAFIQNPLNDRYPERIYRTGDLARRDAEGNLIFLARRDDQVKHMGYRIELGEVEAALSAVPGVEAAACLFDPREDKLVCFCQSGASPQALAEAAKIRLPKYMVPNVWRIEQRLPVNANGKIDRVKLKEQYFGEN